MWLWEKINRSARILIEYNNEEKDNFFEYPDFIPIYMNIIYFYFNIEYNEILAKKRDILNLILKNKNEDIYSKYIEINKEISYYEGILSSISIKYYNDLYVNKDIKSTFNYQKVDINIYTTKIKKLIKNLIIILLLKVLKIHCISLKFLYGLL